MIRLLQSMLWQEGKLNRTAWLYLNNFVVWYRMSISFHYTVFLLRSSNLMLQLYTTEECKCLLMICGRPCSQNQVQWISKSFRSLLTHRSARDWGQKLQVSGLCSYFTHLGRLFPISTSSTPNTLSCFTTHSQDIKPIFCFKQPECYAFSKCTCQGLSLGL